MHTSIIIEARMGSTRLPGKVLLKIKKKTMLEIMVSRLRVLVKRRKIKHIIIATTTLKEDLAIVKVAKKLKVKFFQGSKNNLVKRVLDASQKFNVTNIVSLTADCPIIDIEILEQMLEIYINNNCDFLTNAHIRSYPDGMDTQIFKRVSLKKAYELCKDSRAIEHTTLSLRRNPDKFKTINILAPKSLRWPELGLTLDEKEDFELLKKIILNLKKNFNLLDVITYLKKNNKILNINKHVKRNTYDV